ncbi:hypothetical protein RintRC_3393 [Richelia intracellularis]|nr:hypothetical protein RintRC_3393 [Richelia intracellularis]
MSPSDPHNLTNQSRKLTSQRKRSQLLSCCKKRLNIFCKYTEAEVEEGGKTS